MTTNLHFPPLHLCRTLIVEWADALERLPEEKREKGAMRSGGGFCALGVFADLAVRKIEMLAWEECTELADLEPDDPTSLPIYGIWHKRYGGVDIRGFSFELRWLVGFSSVEEAQISGWNDRGVPLSTIARRLREIYCGDGLVLKDTDLVWEHLTSMMPERHPDPEVRIGHAELSVWRARIESVHEGAIVLPAYP